jgi:hypothetical protein
MQITDDDSGVKKESYAKTGNPAISSLSARSRPEALRPRLATGMP